jgi:hypothetical protein
VSAFEMVHRDRVASKLCCFDRMIFKGHLTGLLPPGAFKAFLDRQHVLLKDFAGYVKTASESLKVHAQRVAAGAGRPYVYLADTHTRARGIAKEELARQIAERDGVTEGLICVLAAVEPCSSFDVYRDREAGRLEVVRRRRKCLFFYFYLCHEDLGFCHLRLQSWFPFEFQAWVNGREILARAFDRRGISYLRHYNAFLRVGDPTLAQRLADKLASRRWHRTLGALARWVNPMLPTIGRAGFGSYYFVAEQIEVATDIVFCSRPALEDVLEHLVAHAASAFSAEDILRFLGRKLHPQLACEVTSDARRRPEGWRVKHRMGRNTIKLYDKVSALRVETTINDPEQFRVLREKDGHRVWCPMRKGVANLPRYFQVGSAANERYLEALAAAHDNREGVTALEALCRPRTNRGRRHARFNPIVGSDLALFRAALAGEHTIVGFNNTDLQRRLYRQPPATPEEARRRCARTSRLITKMRGHGLVAKIKNRRRYRLTPYGQRVLTAAIAVHDHHFPTLYAAA